MDPSAAEFLGPAFAHAPASEANSAIARVREEQDAEGGGALSYELVLPQEGVREHLVGRVLPRLVDYLESVRAKLPDCPGVFLSVFAGDTLHFLHARDAIACLSRWSGLSSDELRTRFGPR
jgi:hypothetical protein